MLNASLSSLPIKVEVDAIFQLDLNLNICEMKICAWPRFIYQEVCPCSLFPDHIAAFVRPKLQYPSLVMMVVMMMTMITVVFSPLSSILCHLPCYDDDYEDDEDDNHHITSFVHPKLQYPSLIMPSHDFRSHTSNTLQYY